MQFPPYRRFYRNNTFWINDPIWEIAVANLFGEVRAFVIRRMMAYHILHARNGASEGGIPTTKEVLFDLLLVHINDLL